MSRCPRCLEESANTPGYIHTCTPTEGWAKMEARIAELEGVISRVQSCDCACCPQCAAEIAELEEQNKRPRERDILNSHDVLEPERREDLARRNPGIKWVSPKDALPKGTDVEVLVRGHSDWINGNYYIALWDGTGFMGCGGFDWCEYRPVEAWAYLDA